MSAGAAESRFDVVIVGARCAGAALARHLAGAGVSVVLLDAAELPSDQKSSTHLVQPPGVEELDGIGIGDAVRQASPALTEFRLTYDEHQIQLPYGEGQAAHCLRRETLDDALQRAAEVAGAELRDRTRVVDLIRGDQGEVLGVIAERHGTQRERIHADLVVGADGRNSTVAKLVAADEYLGYEGPRAVYWAYWPRPAGWSPHVLDNTFQGTSARIIFPTDGDQLLIATTPPLGEAMQWRRAHTDAYLDDIRAYEPVSSFLGDLRPVGEVRSALKLRYFFREAAGAGWALIGDAGHHKEFVIGLGITDALRDARQLSYAIVDRGPGKLEQWWRQRDVERIEMAMWSRDLGNAEPVDALQRLIPPRVAVSPDLMGRFGKVISGELSPYDLVPAAAGARWVAAALARGEVGVLPPFLRTARRRVDAKRELRRRRRLASESVRLPADGAISAEGRLHDPLGA